jgi:galactan 5-O-arabinofuranosyltransferase
VAWQSLIGLLNAAPDPYFFFATSVDPAYVAISVTDLPGQLAKGVWPPPGELGGVGVYTGLVIIALGIAVWLGFRRTAVITTAAIFAGAWLMRFYYASEMYRSNLVNYWTRTTLELEYLFVALAVFAIMLAAGRLRQSAAQHGLPETPGPARHAATAGLRASGTAAQQALPGLVALMLAGALFAGSAASAITDRFMPADNNSPGQLAWAAHHEKPSQLDTHVKTLVNGK